MVTQDSESIRIAAENYQVHSRKEGFQFGFAHLSGAVIGPGHTDSGLKFGEPGRANAARRQQRAGGVAGGCKRTGRFGGRGNLPFGPLRAFLCQAA